MYNSIFHLTIPFIDSEVIKKYQMLKVNKNFTTIIQSTHSKQLIDEFINEYRNELVMNMKNVNSEQTLDLSDSDNTKSNDYEELEQQSKLVKSSLQLRHYASMSTNESIE